MEFPSNPVELPDCQLNWEFIKADKFFHTNAIDSASDSVIGSGGGLAGSPSWSNLIQINVTAPSTWGLMCEVHWQIRIGTSTAAWNWGATSMTASGATILAGVNPQGVTWLNSGGPGFGHCLGSGLIQIPKSTTVPIIIRANTSGSIVWDAVNQSFAWALAFKDV